VVKKGRYVPDVQQTPAGPTLELGGDGDAAQGPTYEWVDPAPGKEWWGFLDFLKGFLG
jgi:hypothetical protein